jgi:hypothetical protein
VLVFPQIAMWFPNWLDERRKAARSVQLDRPPIANVLTDWVAKGPRW